MLHYATDSLAYYEMNKRYIFQFFIVCRERAKFPQYSSVGQLYTIGRN